MPSILPHDSVGSAARFYSHSEKHVHNGTRRYKKSPRSPTQNSFNGNPLYSFKEKYIYTNLSCWSFPLLEYRSANYENYGIHLEKYCSSPPNLQPFLSASKTVGFSPPMLFIHRATAPAIKPPLHLLQEIQFLASGCEKTGHPPQNSKVKGRFLWGAYVEPTWRKEVKRTSASQWKLQGTNIPQSQSKVPNKSCKK